MLAQTLALALVLSLVACGGSGPGPSRGVDGAPDSVDLTGSDSSIPDAAAPYADAVAPVSDGAVDSAAYDAPVDADGDADAAPPIDPCCVDPDLPQCLAHACRVPTDNPDACAADPTLLGCPGAS